MYYLQIMLSKVVINEEYIRSWEKSVKKEQITKQCNKNLSKSLSIIKRA